MGAEHAVGDNAAYLSCFVSQDVGTSKYLKETWDTGGGWERKNNFLAKERGKYFLGPCQSDHHEWLFVSAFNKREFIETCAQVP